MIKFFRRIRQNMIKESKVSKYLLYAIGEIVLVVIGILIALSINNWNEQKKTNKKELSMLTEVKNALNANKEILKTRSDSFNILKHRGKLLQEHLTNKLVYHDTLESYLNIPQRNYSFRLSFSTYENLKSQGFDIISNEGLRLDIIKLYDEHFGLLKDQEDKMSDILTNSIEPILFKYFKTTLNGGLKPNDYEQLLNNSEYSNMLSFMIFLANGFEEHCQKFVIEIEKVLNSIESEIAKRK